MRQTAAAADDLADDLSRSFVQRLANVIEDEAEEERFLDELDAIAGRHPRDLAIRQAIATAELAVTLLAVIGRKDLSAGVAGLLHPGRSSSS